MAVTTPDAVPGELITAAWGDAVRADLTALDATRLIKTGDTATGHIYFGADPVAANSGHLLMTNGRFISTIASPSDAANPNLAIQRRGSTGTPGEANSKYVSFRRSASTSSPVDAEIGSISINAGITGVTYATTSDHRVKQAGGPVTDAAARAQTLGHAAFRGYGLHADTGEPVGAEADLLVAHDIAAVAPYAVTGERDAVDGDGNPVYQQVAYGELVPLLFAALADALDRIAALEGAV